MARRSGSGAVIALSPSGRGEGMNKYTVSIHCEVSDGTDYVEVIAHCENDAPIIAEMKHKEWCGSLCNPEWDSRYEGWIAFDLEQRVEA
tara:strand:+ start:146 stop:412 length:267 start_codon:yes stop_codon:yes gene_type:complete